MNVTNPVVKVLLYIAAGIGIIAICGILCCCGSLAFVSFFADTGPSVPPTAAPTRWATTIPLATPIPESYNGNLLWPTSNPTDLASGENPDRYYHNLQSVKSDIPSLGLQQNDVILFNCQQTNNEEIINIYVWDIAHQTCTSGFITLWPDESRPMPSN